MPDDKNGLCAAKHINFAERREGQHVSARKDMIWIGIFSVKIQRILRNLFSPIVV